MKPAVFFITGTSGSGKSTLVDILQEKLPLVEVHDFDEGGVPENPNDQWRKERTSEWVVKAETYLSKGITTIICGVSVPHEVKSCPAYSGLFPIYYGFIRITEEEIRRRLQARGWEGKLIEENIQWAKQLESYVRAEKNHFIVDGENNNPQQTAEKFVKWIASKSYS